MSFLDLFGKEPPPKDLQCGYCSNLLSVPGVTVPDDQGNSYACGRCSKTQGSSIGAVAYEAVAPNVKFPCRYRMFGCNRQLSWGGVLDHEKACDHRVFDCFGKGCDWQGSMSMLKVHVLDRHPDIIINNGSFKVPTDDGETLYLMFAYNELFLIQSLVGDSTFSLSVNYIGKPPDCGRFTYEAEIKEAGSKRKSSVKLYSGKLKPFADYTNQKMDAKLKLNSLEELLNTRNVSCYITITEKQAKKEKTAKQKNGKDDKKADKSSKSEELVDSVTTTSNVAKPKATIKGKKSDASANQGASVSKQEKQINENMVRELECPVCQEYMCPPIFLCSLGHSICGECKPKLSKCPTCSSEYGNTRNYTLESMLQLVQLPCRNANEGCSFIGNLPSVQAHKEDCKYETVQCPVPIDCKWKGGIDLLLNHLRNTHKTVFVKINEIIKHNLNVAEPDYNFLQYEGELFRISCKHGKKSNSFVQWSFQRVSWARQHRHYKIEIEFLDQTTNNRKFVINDVFRSLSEKNDIFNDVLAIPISLLQPFIDSSKFIQFRYKIYI